MACGGEVPDRTLTPQETTAVIIFVILFSVIQIFLIMWLWNVVVPKITASNLSEINFMDALGIRVLVLLLFQV